MSRNRLSWWTALGLILLSFAASALLAPRLPDTVPTHWNIRGEVDGWGPKAVALWLMPCVTVGLFGLLSVLPVLSPKNFEVDAAKGAFLFIVVSCVGLFCYLHLVILYSTWKAIRHEPALDIGRLILGGVFLYLALMGSVMGKVRRNFFVGVRVPWTLASERVWDDTHRLAAWTMGGGGLLGFLAVVSGMPVAVSFAVLVVSVLVPVVYSFVHYKRLERRGAL